MNWKLSRNSQFKIIHILPDGAKKASSFKKIFDGFQTFLSLCCNINMNISLIWKIIQHTCNHVRIIYLKNLS